MACVDTVQNHKIIHCSDHFISSSWFFPAILPIKYWYICETIKLCSAHVNSLSVFLTFSDHVSFDRHVIDFERVVGQNVTQCMVQSNASKQHLCLLLSPTGNKLLYDNR